MKRLFLLIMVFGCMQLLIAEVDHKELISPELKLDEESSQHDANANTTLRSNYDQLKLPYGITLDKRSHENEDLSHGEVYTFHQNGEVIDEIEGYYIYDIYDGDMDKDGVRDLIFKTYSGGAHCCFDLYIAQLTEKMQKPNKITLRNLDTIEYKDFDGDGIQEWIMYDDRYSYFLTCFACSPAVQMVASYKKGKLILRPKLTKKHTADRLEKLTVSHVSLGNYGYLNINPEYAPAVINSFLYHFYTGNTSEALHVIGKYLTFEDRGVKLLFLKALTQSMSESYFWDQLRMLNHLYDTGINSSVEYYEVESIARNFFKKMESIKSSNKWLDPTQKICQKNGGEYDTKHGVCESSAETSNAICHDTGGRVPSLDDFEQLVKECGSELNYFDGSKERTEEAKKNKENYVYQICYKKEGFKSAYGYWTSTAHSANDPSLIYVYLKESIYNWYDGWRKHIRCIKE